jgi:hypothetical protein
MLERAVLMPLMQMLTYEGWVWLIPRQGLAAKKSIVYDESFIVLVFSMIFHLRRQYQIE